MKIVKLYFPIFQITYSDRIFETKHGKGHHRVEDAFAEGLAHKAEYPNGNVIQLDTRKEHQVFIDRVESAYVQKPTDYFLSLK